MNKEIETIKYENDDVKLNIKYDENNKTLWMSLKEICLLFKRDKSVISRHIKNIFLQYYGHNSESVVAFFATTGQDGKTYNTKYYNLDVVLKIGDRIKTNKAFLLQQYFDDYLNNKDIKRSDIIVYNNGNISLDVTVSPSEDTVWLSQDQIAELYETTRPNITIHIKKIFADGELNNSVGKFYLHTAMDGKTYQTTKYNLDMILAIGYRVRSKRAVEFRNWREIM